MIKRAEVPSLVDTAGGQIGASAAPSDRAFRDAWRLNGGVIEIDMPAAREAARSHIRRARAPQLAALDLAFMRAIEEGGDLIAIRAKKQRLRDAPQDARLAAADTPDALKAALDQILGELA